MLSELSADIFVLQEIEDCGTLGLLRSAMGDSGSMYVPYLVPGTDTHLRMNVALLTRCRAPRSKHSHVAAAACRPNKTTKQLMLPVICPSSFLMTAPAS